MRKKQAAPLRKAAYNFADIAHNAGVSVGALTVSPFVTFPSSPSVAGFKKTQRKN